MELLLESSLDDDDDDDDRDDDDNMCVPANERTNSIAITPLDGSARDARTNERTERIESFGRMRRRLGTKFETERKTDDATRVNARTFVNAGI